MRRLALICLLCINCLTAVWADTASALTQGVLPTTEGQRREYSAYIEMSRAYVSGICVLLMDEGVIKGALFNEFGVTALEFTFYPERRKVKLHNVMKLMDKWYIRRVLRKDLAQLMVLMEQGETTYKNERRHITYQLTPMKDEVTQ